MDTLQFYPTPPELAERAFGLFRRKRFFRVLDPSAGRGDLLAPLKDCHQQRNCRTDVIEIDPKHHPVLKDKGYRIVGFDFLKHGSVACYTEIILNPPFAHGVAHVLKAWDGAYDAEIVAILAAHSVRDALSVQERRLAALIAKHGTVEYIQGAFSDAERETDVEIALIWLDKRPALESVVGDLISDLKRETGQPEAPTWKTPTALALPNSVIESTVMAFNAAVRAAQDHTESSARLMYYSRQLGKTLAERNGEAQPSWQPAETDIQDEVHKAFVEEYETLKDRAWANVLRSTQVATKLTRSTRAQLEADFEAIKALEFTVENIYGFLLSLVQSAPERDNQCICDVFDLITKYSSDNTSYFMSWRSNDKHRTCGRRVKMTRFILPGFSGGSRHSLPYDADRVLADIDRAFTVLNGGTEPEMSLTELFKVRWGDLRHSERCDATFFSVRYYPGIGTIHFYPRDKRLIERLNRRVSLIRNWIPPEVTMAGPDFWKHFEQADKFDKAAREHFKSRRESESFTDRRPRIDALHHEREDQHAQAHARMAEAVIEVTADANLNIVLALAHPGESGTQPPSDLPALALAS